MNLKTLFPYGSNSFFNQNSQAHGCLPTSEPKQDAALALGHKSKRETKIRGRVRVLYRLFTCRPFDADNMAGGLKAGQDVLSAVRLIPADDPYAISVTWEQVKVNHYADQKLEIEITK